MKPVILSVRHVRQQAEGECVAACASMVLGYMGLTVAYDQLLKLIRVNWFGTPFFKLRELEQLGVTVIYKQGLLRELHEHLLNDRPCIAFVRTSELSYWSLATDHSVVVVGLDDKSVYLNDPEFADAPIPVSRGDFDLAWLERDEIYAVLLKRR
ncbi:MAG TPA: cysteine peptidase family C39 domain-containing protein [Anaerolineales bacterium]|nr:cysteine peptidase family C39 domain-containing protein [Anaerolineales bacterium]